MTIQTNQGIKSKSFKPTSKRPLLALAVAAALGAQMCRTAHAGTYTWTGLTNSIWDTTSNDWSGAGTTWSNGNAAVFNATGAGTITLGATAINPTTITFNNAGYTLTGGTLTLASGGDVANITVASGVSATIASTIADLTTSGHIDVGGTGTLILTGNNTYTGQTTINGGGVLSISSLAAINGSSSSYLALQTGTLIYTGTGSESRSGALYWNSGFGNIINVTSATANLTFNITGGTRNYDITKAGPGTLTLSKSTAINDVTASAVNITGGTLVYNENNSGAIDRFSSTVTGAAGTMISVTGTGYIGNESLAANWASNLASLNIGSGAAFDLRGQGITIDALTGSGNMDNSYANGTDILTVGANNGSGTFSGVIQQIGPAVLGTTGSPITALTKKGTGTQTLSGANSYTAATTVENGALVAGTNSLVSANGAFGNASSAIALGDATTISSNLSPSLLINGAFTVGRAITVGSSNAATSGIYTIGGSNTSGTAAYTSAITLNQALTLIAATGGLVDFNTGAWTTNNKPLTIGITGNTGTVELDNAISTSGGITVSFGTLALDSAFTSGTMIVQSGATLSGNGSVAGTTDVTSGTVNGTGGGLTLTGLATFHSTGNTLSGIENATNGVTLASSAVVSQTGGTLTGNVTQNSSSALTANGTVTGTDSLASLATLSGTGTVSGAVTLAGSNTLSSSSTLTLGSTLGVSGTGNQISSGVVSVAGLTTVNGSGATLTVAGGSTLQGIGNVTVNSGGFLVANGTVSKAVSVSGTLSGGGSTGAVAVLSGGTVSPGNSPGNLSASSETWNGGGNYKFEIATLNPTGGGTQTNAGTNYDTLTVSGALDLSALTSSSKFNINVNAASLTGWTSTGTYHWTLATVGSFTNPGGGFNSNLFNVDLTNFTGMSTTGPGFSVSESGGNLLLLDYVGGTAAFGITNSSPVILNVLRNTTGGSTATAAINVTNSGNIAGTASFSGLSAPLTNPATTGSIAGSGGTGSSNLTLDVTNYASDNTGQTLTVTPNAGHTTGTATVTVQYNVGNAVANNSNSLSAFGTPLTAAVSAGTNVYANLSSRPTSTTGSGGTDKSSLVQAIIRQSGTTATGTAVSEAWRTVTTQDAAPVFTDVVELAGFDATTSYVVLEMTYDPTTLGSTPESVLFLGREIGNTGAWHNAGNDSFAKLGAWSGQTLVGDWGQDLTNHDVWAVVTLDSLAANNNFAVIPEPTSIGLLGLGALTLLSRRRKNRAS